MRKNDLIAVLHAIPGNDEVELFDVKRNVLDNTGAGSVAGFYRDFDVHRIHIKAIDGRVIDKDVIAIVFANKYLDKEDQNLVDSLQDYDEGSSDSKRVSKACYSSTKQHHDD